MPWIYERPNEYVVFCFVFYIKKVFKNRTNFHIPYYSGLVKVIPKFFGSRTSICKSFFIMYPNLMSHQFSAQPARKDKINSKINNTKSIKK